MTAVIFCCLVIYYENSVSLLLNGNCKLHILLA